jgi:Protein of unknown function (DUF2946)
MDEMVRRAMARWPNVPAVFGWLRLDRRGNWLLRLAEGEPSQFDRVTNPAFIQFINRNCASDSLGRHYFQNGPQRVYVTLDYTPWVARLNDNEDALITHNELAISPWSAAYVDEDGAMILATNLGAALLIDRDLPRVVDSLVDSAGNAIDAEVFFDRIAAGAVLEVSMLGQSTRVASIRRAHVPDHFGFVLEPAL